MVSQNTLLKHLSWNMHLKQQDAVGLMPSHHFISHPKDIAEKEKINIVSLFYVYDNDAVIYACTAILKSINRNKLTRRTSYFFSYHFMLFY